MPRHRIVSIAEIGAHPRHSFSASDWIFSTGDKVIVDGGQVGVVVWQDENTLGVAPIYTVPGSSTAFACGLPQPVHLFNVRRPRRHDR